jgi:hypothetical protein
MTIFYMALENIVKPNQHARWVITFAFGLIHGFGFSFVLEHTLQFAGTHLLTLAARVQCRRRAWPASGALDPGAAAQPALQARRHRTPGHDHPLRHRLVTPRGIG